MQRHSRLVPEINRTDQSEYLSLDRIRRPAPVVRSLPSLPVRSSRSWMQQNSEAAAVLGGATASIPRPNWKQQQGMLLPLYFQPSSPPPPPLPGRFSNFRAAIAIPLTGISWAHIACCCPVSPHPKLSAVCIRLSSNQSKNRLGQVNKRSIISKFFCTNIPSETNHLMSKICM